MYFFSRHQSHIEKLILKKIFSNQVAESPKSLLCVFLDFLPLGILKRITYKSIDKYYFTDLTKINRPGHAGHSIRMYWTNFWQLAVHEQKIFSFRKNSIEVGNPYLYASFSTFCVQIGQLFEAQWVFETCLKINKLFSSKENVRRFRNSSVQMFKD